MPPKGPKNRAHSNGVSAPVRRSRTSLAALLREDFPNEIISEFYRVILEGKMPVLVKDERCTTTGGWKVVADPDDQYTKPTLDQRMNALARVLDRRDGLPAQHVHIEAELRAEMTAIAAGVDTRYLQSLSPEALKSIREAVRSMKALPPSPSPEPVEETDVIDAEFTDVDE